ncbi:SGNH/GDSL hydrolase family protein [Shewanella baltica]|uniref:SGNH/GDSL hydrolase family protein n=1 Tax=Shewanella baltica TaxID=62322 RepID=UPI00217DD462|nr:SGNH/GDSL hydrolase family protein [Shewanella baltica]MCS6236768.1 SGNH/GDSL hydrolase family protein [Shewanella baltica]MCS6271263.1 SGNH/GDSL hydrolase family protein [Shewanella baltica]
MPFRIVQGTIFVPLNTNTQHLNPTIPIKHIQPLLASSKYPHSLLKYQHHKSVVKGPVSTQDTIDGPNQVTDFSHRLFEVAVNDHQERQQRLSKPLTGHDHASLNHIKRLVVIGDSLSDSEGRMKSKTLGIMLSSKQYHDGRFTNGFVWPDFISSPAYLNKELVNYAEGGAVAAKYSKLNPVFWFISNMERQIKKHDFRSNDLVILALGSNDYMTFDKKDTQKVVHCYEKQITTLVENKKIKNILVTGIPDFTKTAYAQKQDEAYHASNSVLVSGHNASLSQKVTELAERYKAEGVNIQFFDFDNQFTELLDKADKAGYDTHTANSVGYVDIFGTSKAFDPAHRHVFHDEVHPSQEVHQMLASRMSDYITGKFGKLTTIKN